MLIEYHFRGQTMYFSEELTKDEIKKYEKMFGPLIYIQKGGSLMYYTFRETMGIYTDLAKMDRNNSKVNGIKFNKKKTKKYGKIRRKKK